ncbi:Uncharacterised protein [Mycobacteroides abscessus subsp. abscessus]|nr:Uncharacterised protein [Mycobacteroides abscessus subsp. abscessus]
MHEPHPHGQLDLFGTGDEAVAIEDHREEPVGLGQPLGALIAESAGGSGRRRHIRVHHGVEDREGRHDGGSRCCHLSRALSAPLRLPGIPPWRDAVGIGEQRPQCLGRVAQAIDAVLDGLLEQCAGLGGTELVEQLYDGIHQLVALPHVVVEHASRRGGGHLVFDIEPRVEQVVPTVAPYPAELVLALGDRP